MNDWIDMIVTRAVINVKRDYAWLSSRLHESSAALAHGVSYHSGIIPGMNLTMDRTERFYKIDQLLQNRPTVPIREFLDALGVSLATFKRDLEYMRDRLNAPIVWDRDSNGYRFEQAKGAGARYELPGLWFNPSEAQALLTLETRAKVRIVR